VLVSRAVAFSATTAGTPARSTAATSSSGDLASASRHDAAVMPFSSGDEDGACRGSVPSYQRLVRRYTWSFHIDVNPRFGHPRPGVQVSQRWETATASRVARSAARTNLRFCRRFALW
jgi:hypothetical protein